MKQSSNGDRLEGVLDQQLSLAKQLICVLEREWKAISNRHFDDLSNCSTEKTSLSNELDFLESQRCEIAEQLQRENSASQPKSSGPDRLQKKWTELKDMVADIKERNIQNGMLINQCVVHNKQSLTIMFGEKDEERSSTYRANGVHTSAPTSGSIGHA